MNRILLVEDHPSFRQSLAALLDLEPDLRVVGQAASLAESHNLIASNGFDVAVIDLGLPDGNGVALIGRLREIHPHASVLVLTISVDPEKHVQAREAGADVILSKAVALDEIIGAVRRLGGSRLAVTT